MDADINAPHKQSQAARREGGPSTVNNSRRSTRRRCSATRSYLGNSQGCQRLPGTQIVLILRADPITRRLALAASLKPSLQFVVEGEDHPATFARNPVHRQCALALPTLGGPDITPQEIGDCLPGIEPAAVACRLRFAAFHSEFPQASRFVSLPAASSRFVSLETPSSKHYTLHDR